LRYTTNGGTNWLLTPNGPSSTNYYGLINAWDWLDTGKFWIGTANVLPNATSSKVTGHQADLQVVHGVLQKL